MNHHPTDELSAYADGELPPDATRRVAEHLEACTECARELSLIRTLGGAMRTLQNRPPDRSTWERVHRRLTRPAGWILIVLGAVLWGGLALASWLRRELTLEWLAGTALGVGLLMLLVGIAYEQYREWRGSPYRDIER
jgi:anti-sigma factor RsiW